MRDFLKWCEAEINRATVAGIMCLFLIIVLSAGALTISIVALVSGYWIVPVLMLVAAPVAVIIIAWTNRQD